MKDQELTGTRLLVLELNQEPFAQASILDSSEIDTMDLGKVTKSEWRLFRRNISGTLRRELRQFSSRDQSRRIGQKKLETEVSKLARENPGFDPVFMKV
jgi:hypothetical protein